jgi:hypothetical protein
MMVENYSQGELIMKARDSSLAMTSEEQRDPVAQAWQAEIGNIIKDAQAMRKSKFSAGTMKQE